MCSLLTLSQKNWAEQKYIPSLINYKGKYLFLNKFYRREFRFNSHYNNKLIDTLNSIIRDKKAITKISIENNVLGLTPYKIITLADHIYGLLFNYKMLDDLNNIGKTIYYDKTSTEMSKDKYENRTDFFLGVEDGDERNDYKKKRTIEIEELISINKMPNEKKEGDLILTRYLHAERDVNNNCFTHVDGAIKKYSVEEYNFRLGEDLKEFGRKAKKEKVFRVDGVIENNVFEDLTTYFFRNNKEIELYFQGKKK
jgi:hypothetical protein